MTDLTQAIEELRRVTPPNSPWEAGDIGAGSSPVDYHIATTLNAVLSGDLIPKADADLAVALMVEQCAKGADRRYAAGDMGNPGHHIRALAPASALAELQALRDARTALTGDRATDFDNDAVYQFSKLMKDKMAKSRAKGRKGWNDPTQCSPDFLRHLLYEHIYKGDPVDVANLCMMLRHYDEPTTPKPEDDLRLLHTEAADAELATLRAQIAALTPPPDFEEGAAIGYAQAMHDIKRLQAQVERLTGALRFYADFHENPNDGPWGINSQDFGKEARAALTEGAAP